MTGSASSRAWSWRHAIIKSGLPPTTRHVLLTLSVHMNEAGKRCYPTVATIVEETGLSKRSVVTHLQAGIEAGWLVRRELGLRGRKWRRCEYEARWPERVGDDIEEGSAVDRSGRIEEQGTDREVGGGGERGSPPEGTKVVKEVHHVAAQGGAPRSNEVVNEVHHYRRTVQESFQKEREGARVRAKRSDRSPSAETASPPRDRASRKPDRSGGKGGSSERLSSEGQSILDMIALYPGGRQDPRGRVEAAWERLTTDERQRAIDELPGWLEERKAARLRRMFLQTYLGERQFDLPKNGTVKSGGNARAEKPGKGRNGVTFVGENLSFRHWSAGWFAHLIWRVTNGKSIGLALQQARANPASGWGCPRAELPDLTVLDHVVHISSRSDEWRAWRKWFEDRDPTAHWPSFDRELWFDLPSHWPPGLEAGRPEGQGALSENPDELPVGMRI